VLRRLVISCLLAALSLPAVARTRPHYGGTLHVEVTGDPLANPRGLARRLIFNGLTTLDSDGAVHPALAVSWQSSNEDRRWQFTLRPGVTFQDGSPLTAAVVADSLNRSCAGNCPWSAVNAVGPSLVFTGSSPMPHLPALLAGDEYLITLTTGQDGQPLRNPTGTGPFQFTSDANGTLTLSANSSCWQGRPFVDTLEIRGHRSIGDQWLDLSVGRADVVKVPPEMLRQAHQQQLTVVTSPPVMLLALQISASGALANPMLRASIAQAVDRSALFNVIFQKQGALTAALLPQQLTGYAFLFPAARDLNNAISLRKGLTASPLKLAAEGDSAMQLAAQRIALNLREAGFPVQVVSGNQQGANMVLRKFSVAGSDPAAVLETLLHNAGQSQPVTAQSPADLYRAEKDILDRHTIVPLLDLPRAWAVSGRVRDFTLRAGGAPDLADSSLEDAP
jgi:peptide/nickel transport system substrate-binding protein